MTTQALAVVEENEVLSAFLANSVLSLVLGGPGSGKTTGALMKANRVLLNGDFHPFQQVLFLSFARSTVARVAEAAGNLISKPNLKRVELTTYHSFAWSLIRSHGYLLQSDPPIRLFPPHDASAHLAEAARGLRGEEASKRIDEECRRLLTEEGRLVFDRFAELAATLLERCDRLCRITSRRFPLIFLDEFQDTNVDEYRLVKCLGKNSRIIALADPEQRIYEFRGADPKRIEDYLRDFSPETFDFAQRNHRSHGTDILTFANDLLTQTNRDKCYSDVRVKTYPPRRGNDQHLWMKTEVIGAINRAKSQQSEWSVAVLVPTKRMMLAVSEYLTGTQPINAVRALPPVFHDVGVDAEGPALAGVVIGRLLECTTGSCDATARVLVEDICRHIVGRKGGKPASQSEVQLIDGLKAYLLQGKTKGVKRQRIVADCSRIADAVATTEFVGDPYADWITVRNIFEASEVEELRDVALDAKFLKFLRKGAQLRMKLAELWKSQRTYRGAADAVQNAFVQEHFVAKSAEPRGVHVMTIHKSKGKEFDEVVIYEGIHFDRIVRQPDDDYVVAQARLSLRVAVSRAKRKVTILTPQQKPCELL